MSYGSAELISGVKEARRNLLKHLDGITPEQYAWKPYPQCKSISETLDHLIWSDLAIVQVASTGKAPDYTTTPMAPPTKSYPELKSEMTRSHAALIDYLTRIYSGGPGDAPIKFYDHATTLGHAVGLILFQEGYHTGQIAFIRMAQDPSWDYYEAIYDHSD